TFLEAIRTRAAANRRRIVFPETADERTRVAIARLAASQIVEPIAILNPDFPETHQAVRRLGLAVRDPQSDPFVSVAADLLLARPTKRPLTKNEATQLVHNSLYFGDALVAAGEADGCVAGATYTTGDVLRAALRMVGAADGVTTVSSSFYMVVP